MTPEITKKDRDFMDKVRSMEIYVRMHCEVCGKDLQCWSNTAITGLCITCYDVKELKEKESSKK